MTRTDFLRLSGVLSRAQEYIGDQGIARLMHYRIARELADELARGNLSFDAERFMRDARAFEG